MSWRTVVIASNAKLDYQISRIWSIAARKCEKLFDGGRIERALSAGGVFQNEATAGGRTGAGKT